MKAAAAIEWNGIPIDTVTLGLLRQHWTGIQDELIAEIDRDYGVFEGRSFRRERWRALAGRERHSLADAPTPGNSSSTDDTFRDMAKAHPKVSPMRELRSALSEMRLSDLAVGSDGRNRTLLSAFRSRTGRCQPSNTKYIFGPSVWLRSLIQAAGRLGRRLYRLEPAGIRHRGGAVRRRGDAGRVPVRRSLPRIRQAGGPRASRRHQANPRRHARAVQAMRARRGLRHGGQEPGAADRPARDRRPRSVAGAPRNLSQVLGMVRRGRRSRHAAASRC